MDQAARDKLDRIAEGVARIDQRTDNLEKWVASQGRSQGDLRRDLADHKADVEAHGARARSGTLHQLAAWGGLAVAAVTAAVEYVKGGHR